MSIHFDTLAHATSVLFDPDAYPIARLEAVRSMFDLFSELAGIDDNAVDTEDAVKTVLPSGEALSPVAAARCVLDVARTTLFLRGLDAAIAAARERFPGRTIHLLYAGCGPFATLALPLCTRYLPDEIRFTLIDIHQRSLDSARSVAERLGLADYIGETIRVDAATYSHPVGDPLHVIVAEVLQCALDKEPQFAVTANLAPQLAPGGLFVPEHIQVDLAFADLRTRLDTAGDRSETMERIVLHRLLDLDAATAPLLMARAAPDASTGTLALPLERVRIPTPPPRTEYTLVLLTTIIVFESIVIGHHESGLTMTRVVDVETPNEGDVIEAQYVLGSAPGFRFAIRTGDDMR